MSKVEPEPESIASRTAKGAGWIIAWRLLTRNIGLVSTLILVRLLQPEDFGLVAIASGFIMAADALSAVGVQDAVIREPRPDRAMYDTAFTLSILRGLLSGLVILALAWPVAQFFGDERLVWVLVTLAAGMALTACENIGIVDFRRNLHFHKEFQLQVWSRLVAVVITIALAFVWRSYWALVIGIFCGRLIRVVQSYLMSPYRPKLTLVAWRRLVGFSLWTWGVTMMIQVRDRTDHAIIGRMLGTNAVGSFAVGYEIGTLTTTELAEPLNRALFSGFATIQDAVERRAAMYLGAIGAAALVVFPAGMGISLIAQPLVHLLLGPQWLSVIDLVQIVAFATTLGVLTSIGSAFLMASGGVRYVFAVLVCGGVVRAPLMVACIWQWGLTGAGVAIACSVAVDQCVGLYVVLPRIGVRITQVLGRLWRPLAACAVMVCVLYALNMAWSPPSDTSTLGLILESATRASVGATTYILALSSLWLLAGRPDGAERNILKLVRDRIPRRG